MASPSHLFLHHVTHQTRQVYEGHTRPSPGPLGVLLQS